MNFKSPTSRILRGKKKRLKRKEWRKIERNKEGGSTSEKRERQKTREAKMWLLYGD